MSHHCWIASLLTLLVYTQSTRAQYGYIRFSDVTNTSSVKVCSAYNDLFKPVPSQAASIPRSFASNYPNESCSNDTTSQYNGQVVFVKRGNCTFAQKARNLQNQSASGVVVVSDTDYFPPPAEKSEYDEINIFVFLITKKSFDLLMEFQQNLINSDNEEPLLWLYAGEKQPYDFSSPLLLLFAVVICSAGAWWQKVRYMSLRSSGNQEGSGDGEENNQIGDLDPQAGRNMSTTHAVVYVSFCSVTLLLMYKFYSYLVYFAIATFFIGSTFALFQVLHAASKRTKFFASARVPYCRIEACPNFKHFSFCGFMLFLCAVAISSTWLIYRHSAHSWILLDLLGASFCMFFVSMIRMPNFKTSGTLLSLLFFYDIFYVFLTPYLTPSGESIMVAVATGAGSGTEEEIPGMFKMPKFFTPECGTNSPGMIGFGDIVFPGLHLGFCAVWDSKLTITTSAKTNIYYITGVAAYAMGLFLTSVALFLMEMGQPALLYIVPCMLLTTLVVSWLRGEVKAIFRGFPDMTLENKHGLQLPSGESGEQNSLLSETLTTEI